MLFRYSLLKSLLVSGLFFATHSASAQTTPPVATHIDSLRAARATKPVCEPAVLTFASGKQVNAWLTYTNPLSFGSIDGYITCLMDRVHCYETNPEAIPRPALKAVSVERLAVVEVSGPQQKHRYEMLKMRGKALGILAENLVSPGPMELFGYAETKPDMLIPVPLPFTIILIPTGTHEKYFWYTRLNSGELQEVPRGRREFAEVMSRAFAACPALAARMQQRSSGTEFNNLPVLVKEYNDFVAKQ